MNYNLAMAKIINELQDFRYLKWSRIRHSSGSAGSFLKSYEVVDGKKKYYKLSDYDAYKGIVGHECINEILVDRLLAKLQIEHLSYELIHALVNVDGKEYETYLCGSYDYKMPGDSKVPLDVYYQMEKSGEESPFDFCVRMGWEEYLYKMLIVDYLILNRDRHGANVEIIRSRTGHTVCPAPLFDHGLSFMFSAHNDEEICAYDTDEEKKVQCFIGTCNSYDNLKLIPPDKLISLSDLLPDKEGMKKLLFEGLEDIVTERFTDKILEMLIKRVQKYEKLRIEG